MPSPSRRLLLPRRSADLAGSDPPEHLSGSLDRPRPCPIPSPNAIRPTSIDEGTEFAFKNRRSLVRSSLERDEGVGGEGEIKTLPDHTQDPNNTRAMPRHRRGLLEALFTLVLLLPAAEAGAQPAPPPSAAPGPLHIHVRGSSELSTVASAEPDGFSLRGELIDDAGSPIPHAAIVLHAFSPDDPRTALHLGSLTRCEGAGRRLGRSAAADETVIETDERGSFCVTGKTSIPKLTLQLRFAGSRLHDPFETRVSVEAEQEHLLRTVLRFEPPPEVIDLDRESVTITASLRVDRSEASRLAGGAARREGLSLTLEDERGTPIADALTGGDGRARFDAKTSAFAAPGPGEVVVRFTGKPGLAKAVASQPVIRRAEVHLALSHSPIPRADADEGFPIDVDVTTSRGPVSGGVVEALRLGPGSTLGEPIGAGRVEQGHARVIASFAAGGATAVPILLRYIPAAPWYRAGPALQTDVHLAGPGILKQVLLALVVLAAAVWIVGGWRRAPKPPSPAGEGVTVSPPSGRPGVQILGPATGFTGWRGVVSDAHDGAPIAGARLSIVAPSFQGDGVIAQAISDGRGEFALDTSHRSDARLVVESGEHSTYEQALPPPNRLAVALITRRRALLDRLVRWAKRQGAPFDATPEPTPGHVRRAATRANAIDVEGWARRVEAVAYGPEPIGEAIEREVRAAEPRR
jgi:hypothetical protein